MKVTQHQPPQVGRAWHTLAAVTLAASLASVGCSALNPAAVDILFPTDIAAAISADTLENAPGHVALIFINATRFDGSTLNYLRGRGVDVDTTEDLRPRVRLRVGIGFVGGATADIEFVDGAEIIDAPLTFEGEGDTITVAATAPPELTEFTLNNTVVLCNVSAVQPTTAFTSTTTSIDMFVPAFLKEITIIEQDLGPTVRELVQTTSPRFVPLLVDEIDDASGAVDVVRNFGTREVPGFPTNLTCGSVITFVLSGEMTLPFVVDEANSNVPGYLDTDTAAQQALPGRFQLTVDVR
ncbi:MAG: hypothetical protein GY842_06195 [bacterium]|nr:hypothetical protein [bacterium]